MQRIITLITSVLSILCAVSLQIVTPEATGLDEPAEGLGLRQEEPNADILDSGSDNFHPLLCEVTFKPTEAGFIEIKNPTASTISLQNFYLSNNEKYALLPAVSDGSTTWSNINSEDFIVRFPPATILKPQEVMVIALDGLGFEGTFGFKPDFEIIGTDPRTTNMVAIDVGLDASLANNDENTILFFWDGASDQVSDVDIVSLGAPLSSGLIRKQSKKSNNGLDSDTIDSAHLLDQTGIPKPAVSHYSGKSTKRLTLDEDSTESIEKGNRPPRHNEMIGNNLIAWDNFFVAPDPGSCCLTLSCYYDAVDLTNTITARATLHHVIDDHQRTPLSSELSWIILEAAAVQDPNDPNRILDVYKNASHRIEGRDRNQWYEKEHAWPESYGFPTDSSTGAYPRSDYHAIFLADATYKASRSDLPYDTCNSNCSEDPSQFNNGQGGTHLGIYPGDSNWRIGAGPTGTWETWIGDFGGRRGDVARALLYMDVRYDGSDHRDGTPEPDLRLTDDRRLLISDPTSPQDPAYMGILSTLLKWHEQDPPDEAERLRNETIFEFQRNRNPFIDHPEWVDCVFITPCSPLLDGFVDGISTDPGSRIPESTSGKPEGASSIAVPALGEAQPTPTFQALQLSLQSQQGAKGLITHLAFDEGSGCTAVDSAGSNNGTLEPDCAGTNNAPSWAIGLFGTSLDFDGIDDYVTVPNSPVLETNAITVSFWVKATIGNGLYQTLISHGGHGTNRWLVQRAGDSSEPIRVSWNGRTVDSTAKNLLEDGEWHHVAFTRDNVSNILNLYFDGVLEKTSTFPSDINYNVVAHNLDIGRRTDVGGIQYVDGQMDDVRIYDRPLTSVEISAIAGGGQNQPPIITILQPDGSNSADQEFIISWTANDPDDDATISLFYDEDDSGADGTLIVSGLSENSSSGQYTWSTVGLTEGIYYIYAVIDDGTNPAVTSYSPGTVTIIHSSDSEGPGVVEINQTESTTFPIQITDSGSYRLSSNLTIPDPDTDAVIISADNVTLDFDGFSILGVTQCLGSPAICTNTGTGSGVVSHQGSNGIILKNGMIQGMGDYGINLGGESHVERMQILSNGGQGVRAEGGNVHDNVVANNGGDGIEVGDGCRVHGNIVRRNGNQGVNANSPGITVSDNAIYDNGSHGIWSGQGNLVAGNVISFNDGFGINIFDNSSAYISNTLTGNNGGNSNPQVDGGVAIGANLCGTNTNCP